MEKIRTFERRAFILSSDPNGEPLAELNELLAEGWRVERAEASRGAEEASWLVVAFHEEPDRRR